MISKGRIRPSQGHIDNVKLPSIDLSSLSMAIMNAEEEASWEKFREKKRSLGLVHPDTLASLKNLTRALHNSGKSSAVEDILKSFIREE